MEKTKKDDKSGLLVHWCRFKYGSHTKQLWHIKIQVKFSLYLNKLHPVKIYVGVEVQLHTFLTLALLQDMETYLLTIYAETLGKSS
jgi:hypothetical protein